MRDTLTDALYEDLLEIERHCPCGARPESIDTHPHVTGCPVERALRHVAQALVDHENLLQCRALLDVKHGDTLYAAIKRYLKKEKPHDVREAS